MAYVDHIENLYKNQDILLFKECFALEKIHGTNAFIRWVAEKKELQFGSGGTKHETFVKLFNQEELTKKFLEGDFPVDRNTTIYGESYAGKEQGMSGTYGPVGKFIVFDVQVGECWLDVPKAEGITKHLGLEFVFYVKIPATVEALNAERDRPSVQAIRNGISSLGENGEIINPKKSEGIVVRPLIELTKNSGDRLISKHKNDDFRETKTPREIDPSKMQVLTEAFAVADEWCVPMRLAHILQKMPDHDISKMKDIINAMLADVLREGSGEFVDSTAVRKAISQKTAILYKEYLKSNLIGK
jgi:hypothetical protein